MTSSCICSTHTEQVQHSTAASAVNAALTMHHFGLAAFTTAWLQVVPRIAILQTSPLQARSRLSRTPYTTEATVPICACTSATSAALSVATASLGLSCRGEHTKVRSILARGDYIRGRAAKASLL